MATIYEVVINRDTCTDCGICDAFCPVDVFDIIDGETTVVAPEKCWGCGTCYGQCPTDSVTVTATGSIPDETDDEPRAKPVSKERQEEFATWEKEIKDALGLRWHPVAIKIVKKGELLPDLKAPSERIRYCQSLLAARRGRSFLMEANAHSCPDGTSILGLTKVPKKLASGDIYILFHKLHDIEAAKQMVNERPRLEEESVRATAVAPLGKAIFEPDVVAITAQPEQIMWLCMSLSYYTGKRFDFHASGYNAQCVETTVIPFTQQKPNISFGCYGCRASSDVSDDVMFMGVPTKLIPNMVRGLKELKKKAIPQSRSKVYLPPFTES